MKQSVIKKTLPLVLLSTLAICCASGKSANRPGQEVVAELRIRLSQAILRGDVEFITDILSDDYIGTDSEGHTANKAGLISLAHDLGSLDPSVKPIPLFALEEVTTRTYGDTIVATGVITARTNYSSYEALIGDAPGIDISQRVQFTDVYVRSGTEWKLVASHTTRNLGPTPTKP